MKVFYDPTFIKKLKKCDVKIRNSFIEKRILFNQDPFHSQLNNHPLKREWEGYRSIDITQDYRALYKEIVIEKELIAYFLDIDTHEKLYRK